MPRPWGFFVCIRYIYTKRFYFFPHENQCLLIKEVRSLGTQMVPLCLACDDSGKKHRPRHKPGVDGDGKVAPPGTRGPHNNPFRIKLLLADCTTEARARDFEHTTRMKIRGSVVS